MTAAPVRRIKPIERATRAAHAVIRVLAPTQLILEKQHDYSTMVRLIDINTCAVVEAKVGIDSLLETCPLIATTQAERHRVMAITAELRVKHRQRIGAYLRQQAVHPDHEAIAVELVEMECCNPTAHDYMVYTAVGRVRGMYPSLFSAPQSACDAAAEPRGNLLTTGGG